MTTYYVRTDGNNGNAGTTDSSGGAWLTLEYAGANVAAGDTVMVRAAAGNAASYPTSSLDYAISAFFTPTSGSAASGLVRWIGYNGTPTIGSPGLGFYNCNFQHWEGLYLVATTNSNGGFGILFGASNCAIRDCVLNMNNQAGLVGTRLDTGEVIGTEVYGGTASPTSSSGAYGIQAGSYATLIHGCRIRKCRDHGIYSTGGGGGTHVLGNLIYGCVGDGINLDPNTTVLARIIGNTIDGNSGHGIFLAGTNTAAWACVRNNLITNHTQSGKAGISVNTSSSDPRKATWGHNNVWNNTTNYTNVTAESTDLSVDPDYVDAANGDFTPQEATLLAAFPTDF